MRQFLLTVLALAFLTDGLGEDAFAKRKRRRKIPKKKVNVEKLEREYWNQISDYSVVQNRIYKKDGRFEIDLFGGYVYSDPFLTTLTGGAVLGFHFTEEWSANLLGWRSFVSGSSAMDKFKSEISSGKDPNVNPTQFYVGAEASWSAVYGKLSVVGWKILYYDLHFLGGLGQTFTETNPELTQHLGLGQRIFLGQNFALRMDFRFMHYMEDIPDKVSGSPDRIIDRRSNLSSVLVLGLSIFPF